MNKELKILHTSDWHLGRSLYGRKRYDEFRSFLNWLYELILEENVDVLLIAGDIFDTGTPGNRARELYFGFLSKVSQSCCRHIIITGGNHDSPSLINAPSKLLKSLNISVLGAITEDLKDEIFLLKDLENNPEAIVCAVPYLREKDIRLSVAGESTEDKSIHFRSGFAKHYEDLHALALKMQAECSDHGFGKIPIITMGHLFTAGGKTREGDGVRDLYVGSLAHVPSDIFASSIDYLALGHLHVPQKVGGQDHFRYSGSPIPMGFGEANQTKNVIVVKWEEGERTIQEINIPCFQSLEQISGAAVDIRERVNELKACDSDCWLEIEYSGNELIGSLREELDEAILGTHIEILRFKNKQVMNRILQAESETESLDDLNEIEVFERCLKVNAFSEKECCELRQSFQYILRMMDEKDEEASL